MNKLKSKIKLVSIVLFMLGSIGIVLLYTKFSVFFVHFIPDDIATYNQIRALALQINDYYDKTGIVVESLHELPDKPEYVDSWGNQIIYKKDEDSRITLVSLGSDSIKGGNRDRTDMIFYYKPSEPDTFYDAGGAIPETANTKYKMQYLKNKIIQYFEKSKVLPESLKDLELNHEYFTNDDKDYWGNPIIYETKQNKITLLSYGQDKEKGENYNYDHVLFFEVKNEVTANK